MGHTVLNLSKLKKYLQPNGNLTNCFKTFCNI